jgi:hypothetical protein
MSLLNRLGVQPAVEDDRHAALPDQAADRVKDFRGLTCSGPEPLQFLGATVPDFTGQLWRRMVALDLEHSPAWQCERRDFGSPTECVGKLKRRRWAVGCGPFPFPRTPTPGRERRLHRRRTCVASGTRPGKGASRLLRCASALRVTGRVPAAETPLRAVSDGLCPIGNRAQGAIDTPRGAVLRTRFSDQEAD